jgi:hypothetical protein
MVKVSSSCLTAFTLFGLLLIDVGKRSGIAHN